MLERESISSHGFFSDANTGIKSLYNYRDYVLLLIIIASQIPTQPSQESEQRKRAWHATSSWVSESYNKSEPSTIWFVCFLQKYFLLEHDFGWKPQQWGICGKTRAVWKTSTPGFWHPEPGSVRQHWRWVFASHSFNAALYWPEPWTHPFHRPSLSLFTSAGFKCLTVFQKNSFIHFLARPKRFARVRIPDSPEMEDSVPIADHCRPALIGTSIALAVIGILIVLGGICFCKSKWSGWPMAILLKTPRFVVDETKTCLSLKFLTTQNWHTSLHCAFFGTKRHVPPEILYKR